MTFPSHTANQLGPPAWPKEASSRMTPTCVSVGGSGSRSPWDPPAQRDGSRSFLQTFTPAQVLPQPTPNLRLNSVTKSSPLSPTRSAKEASSIQVHSWGLLRGHQTSGCWLPEPQMGHGERGPLRMPQSDLPPEAPRPDLPKHTRKKIEMSAGKSMSSELR